MLQINTQPAIEPEGQSIDDELLEVEDVDSDPENDIEPSPEELFDYLEATCTDFLELIRKGARNSS